MSPGRSPAGTGAASPPVAAGGAVFEAGLPGGGLASFRALDPDADLDLVHGWMHQPHVVPFWRLDLDRADLAAYLHRAADDDHQLVLIGPPERTGRGLGRQLLGAVVAWQFAREPATRRVVAEPDARNHRMIHVFERCGFRRAGELELPDKQAALMLRERGAPSSGAAGAPPADLGGADGP